MKRLIRRTIILLAAMALVITTIDLAEARPGGGHSSHHSSSRSSGHSSSRSSHRSSGHSSSRHGSYSHSYSGGGGSSTGSPSGLGIAIFVGSMLWVLWHTMQKDEEKKSPVSVLFHRNLDKENEKTRNTISKDDEGFSLVHFKDFVGLLYMRYMSLKGSEGNMNEIRPFVSNFNMPTGDKAKYTEIAINSIRILDAKSDGKYNRISVCLESDYTRTINGQQSRLHSNVRWQLKRAKNAQSVEPSDNSRICCPNCGANEDFTDAGTCNHCGKAIEPGESAWRLEDVKENTEVLDFNDAFLNYSDTDMETIKIFTSPSKTVAENMAKIAERSGCEKWTDYEAEFNQEILRPALATIYKAWSENDLGKCRHLLTDRQYESMKIWTDYLSENGVRNILDKIQIKHARTVDACVDKYYESITSEVTIVCSDYMVNENGKKVAGHKDPQPFKELFTFVRGVNADNKNFSITNCPSCGAPADKMGETAICEYCGTKISTGKYSWVLSGIEQVC